MPTTEAQLELPSVDSPEFIGLVTAAIVAPYIFCLCIYRYHFVARKTQPSVRGENDKPLKSHAENWRDVLFKPEGISAPVGYMALCLLISQTTSVDLVPIQVKTLSWCPNPLTIFLQFLVFDLLMWHIHYVQHRWRWLYYNTHAVCPTLSLPN
jgi:sterol desaturase/sphingolipid hydroxylase (fatty acid hydroxylase superfamily)